MTSRASHAERALVPGLAPCSDLWHSNAHQARELLPLRSGRRGCGDFGLLQPRALRRGCTDKRLQVLAQVITAHVWMIRACPSLGWLFRALFDGRRRRAGAGPIRWSLGGLHLGLWSPDVGRPLAGSHESSRSLGITSANLGGRGGARDHAPDRVLGGDGGLRM